MGLNRWGIDRSSAHKSSEVETSEGVSLDTWSTTKRSSSSLAICLVPHDCHLHHWLSAQQAVVINREPCIAFSLQRCPASPTWLWAIHHWAFNSSFICKSIRICLAQGDVKFVIRWGAPSWHPCVLQRNSYIHTPFRRTLRKYKRKDYLALVSPDLCVLVCNRL